MKFLAIKGFRTFQHYHKRGAPWIKLYSALLSDVAFLELPEAAQAQLMKLWLLASQMGHPLPNSPKMLAGKITATGKFHLDAIIAAGFLIPCNDLASTDASNLASESASKPASTSASKPLAVRPRDRALAREEEERVERSEKETTSSSSGEAAIAARLTSDADRNALTAVVRSLKEARALPESWFAEMGASLDAMPGHVALTPAQLGVALRDYLGNGAAATPRLKHFREYLRRAAVEEHPKPSRAGARAREDDGYQRGQDALKRMIAEEEAKGAASV